MKKRIPKATVGRLPLYLRCLTDLPPTQTTVSSEQLADMARVNAAKVRKDLSYMGSYGTRGVGYEAEHLRFQISRELGLTRDWRVAIVGVGNLGSALAGYAGFGERGFEIVGLFDAAPDRIGQQVNGLVIESVAGLEEAVAEREVAIGIVTAPAAFAQQAADGLVAGGVRSILNFAPTVLRVPPEVEVRRVDLSMELQILSYYLKSEF